MEHPLVAFMSYFLGGIGYIALFVFIYIRVTPYAEFKLIREGNVAASISLGGAILGFCLPLQRAIAQSVSAADLFVWATVALVVQLLTFIIFVRCLPQLSARVQENVTSKAVLLAVISISIGMINAASMVE